MEVKSPLVSVVMCTHNGERFLQDQLDSLISQTYSNIEIVIVDDNSNDGTKNLLNLFAKKHDVVRLFFNEQNLGYNKNFEKAIGLSKGDFISICDQDDIWLPEKIEKLLNVIGDNWAVFSNSEYVDLNNHSMNTFLLKGQLSTQNYRSILLENYFTGHTSILNKESIPYILPIPSNGFYDWWIGFVCLYHKKLAFHNEILTRYRIHPDSVIRNKMSSSRREKIVNVQLQNFMEYKNLEVSDQRLIAKIRDSLESGGSFNELWPRLLFNFDLFFPKRTNQNFLSRINYLRKFFNREAGKILSR